MFRIRLCRQILTNIGFGNKCDVVQLSFLVYHMQHILYSASISFLLIHLASCYYMEVGNQSGH